MVKIDQDIWTVSEDKTVCVWSAKVISYLLPACVFYSHFAQTRAKLQTMRRHKGAITAISVIGPHVWTSGEDNSVTLWDAQVLSES